MKKFLLSTLLLLAVMCIMPAQAQKCKYDFDKKDPITGERIRRNFHSINLWAKMALYRANDDIRFELNMVRGGEDNFSIPIGTKVFIKLEDESILELKSANKAVPVSFVTGNQVASSFAISYYITKEQIQKIATHGITFIKAMLIDEVSMNYEINKRKSKKIKKSASCMIQA